MTDSEKMDMMLEKLDGIATVIREDIAELKEDMAVLKEEMSEVKEDIAVLKEDVAELKTDVAVLKEEMSEVKKDITVLKEDVRNVKITMEGEIRENIKRVAEGHLDLSRNLKVALQPNNELEMLSIKMRILETDMHGLKQKIS